MSENRIPLSGGDYNGMYLPNPKGTIKPGDYLLITDHPSTSINDQYYLVFSNGVARYDPNDAGRGHALLFTAGEVRE